MLTDLVAPLTAAADPAGGAAADQAAIATAGAVVATTALLALGIGHRSGRVSLLGRLAAFSERGSGLPGWAALPSGLAAGALLTALLGMYWDISLHIDQGRDPGPLANPAHYLILAGLFGVFAAGVLAIVLPVGERPGRAAVYIGRDWYAPVGGVLMAACGAFALLGFPLDDVFHRLFGQDVTLWGPTHLMLIGGAGMTLVGQAVLLAEGMGARRASRPPQSGKPLISPQAASPPPESVKPLISPRVVTAARRVGVMGGLLIGLSTFQGEFDFGVPQYRLVLEPLMVALAGGVALVAARVWIGRGGALGAALFFLAVRGFVSLLVGPVLGETTPSLPLYLGEAACVELAALALARRPLALGAAAGALIGTAGFASEWAWSQLVMPLPWTADLLPEALVLAIVAGVGGGLVGALLALGLRGELPRPRIARAVPVLALAAVAACVVYGLSTETPDGARATVTLHDVRGDGGREANATVRLDPPALGDDAAWVTATAWQGGGLRVDRLERVGDGVFRTTEPVPVHGEWKSVIRVHNGRQIVGVPVYMPADTAIPAPAVPARQRFTREFQRDTKVLQRERKDDVPGWLWTAAAGTVLALYLAFLAALAWGVGRLARRGVRPGDPRRPSAASTERPPLTAPTPLGA